VEKESSARAPSVSHDVITIAPNECLSQPEEIESRKPSSAAEAVALMVDEGLSARERLKMRDTLASIVPRVDFAESAAQALKLIDTYAYSVVFLDAMLPDDEAYEICARIKKHPQQQRATTVMLTGNASPVERVMGMLAGFEHFLAKPIRPEGISELAAELARPAAAL
jgi:CheY-like chemotaxis protein